VALPDGHEDVNPDFAHHPAAALPHLRVGGVDLTIIAGHGFGRTSPVATLWPTYYVHAQLPAGATLEVPVEHAERAVYVVQGAIVAGRTPVPEGRMAVLAPAALSLAALADSRVMLPGGERFPTPRYLYWNFVASSRERIERAKERWRKHQFPAVPDETEFIPLPT
jgi:redox-sensitive bicupin YhaK (pirin superfamily)